MAGSLPIISSVVGIGSGLNSLFGGGSGSPSASQADPFGPYRAQYAQQLQALMANPSSVTQLPQYQFNYGQGLQALQAQQAKQGNLVSGAALNQAQQYGQNYAQSAYANQLNTLGQLSGATQAPGLGAQAQSNIAAANLASQLGATQNVLGGLSTLYNQVGGYGSTPNYGYMQNFGAAGSGDVLSGTNYSFG